jgi:hypothetical protein
MELEEIKVRLDRIRDTLDRGGKFDIDWAVEVLAAAREYLDDVEDDPPVKVDDGFVILPVTRYEALREAEENLQETRFEPTVSDQQDRIDALTRLIDQLKVAIEGRDRTIAHLKEAAKVRAEAAAPGATASEPQLHPVLDKHLQDLQGEIDGIKDRLDEVCGQSNGISAAIGNLRDGDRVAGNELCRLNDRINAVAARVNRLDADIMPFRRIGPVTGPEDQRRDEATRDRMLREIKRVTGGVESTKP